MPYPHTRSKAAKVCDTGEELRREIVPALGGAWCFAYLVEIIRCTATIYGYFGTP